MRTEDLSVSLSSMIMLTNHLVDRCANSLNHNWAQADPWVHLQVCIPSSKPRVFSSNDLTSLGPGAWSGCGTGATAGPPETVMVRQYGFPSCQGSAPSSAPASTGFVPPTGHRQVGLLKGVAAKPPLSNSPSSGVCDSARHLTGACPCDCFIHSRTRVIPMPSLNSCCSAYPMQLPTQLPEASGVSIQHNSAQDQNT